MDATPTRIPSPWGDRGAAPASTWTRASWSYEYNMMIIERYTARSIYRIAAGRHRRIDVTTTLAGAQQLSPALVALNVKGQEVARTSVKSTVPATFSARETIELGVELGSTVFLKPCFPALPLMRTPLASVAAGLLASSLQAGGEMAQIGGAPPCPCSRMPRCPDCGHSTSRCGGGALWEWQQRHGCPLKSLRDPQDQQQCHGGDHEPRRAEVSVSVRQRQGGWVGST